MDKLKVFFSNRLNLVLILVLIAVVVGIFFTGQKIISNAKQEPVLEEVDLAFDAEGPYAILSPRRDGNALILNIFRVSSYEAISYDLTYQSEGIDRGVHGDINAKERKSEYSQEVLFGTCSQGFTSGSAHCVFDKNVENGTLVLKIKNPGENRLYRMVTTWHLQRPDIALGEITSGDGHFVYKTDASREELSNIGWTIVNDLTGAPKLSSGRQISGKVYALNTPLAKEFPGGSLKIELIDVPGGESKIAWFDESKNSWDELDTKIESNKLSAKVSTSGIFAVLAPAPK